MWVCCCYEVFSIPFGTLCHVPRCRRLLLFSTDDGGEHRVKTGVNEFLRTPLRFRMHRHKGKLSEAYYYYIAFVDGCSFCCFFSRPFGRTRRILALTHMCMHRTTSTTRQRMCREKGKDLTIERVEGDNEWKRPHCCRRCVCRSIGTRRNDRAKDESLGKRPGGANEREMGTLTTHKKSVRQCQDVIHGPCGLVFRYCSQVLQMLHFRRKSKNCRSRTGRRPGTSSGG